MERHWIGRKRENGEEGVVTIDSNVLFLLRFLCFIFHTARCFEQYFFHLFSGTESPSTQSTYTIYFQIKESAMSNISYLFGPIIAVVIVFAILGCLLLFFVIRGNNAMHGHYSPSSHEFTQNRMAVS